MAEIKNIDKNMEENIKNYANKIQTIESFTEAVRQMPGMYIGAIGNVGFLNCIREIYQNSIDQLQRPDSPCDHIWISFDERDHSTYIRDNGLGIPFDNIIRVFTSEHTSSNYTKSDYQYTSGRHGIGSKCTVALSSTFHVESYILGKARKVDFIEGRPTSEEIEIPNKDNYQGTIIKFTPCYDVMGSITTTAQDVFNMVYAIFPLTKIGAVIDFIGIDANGKEVINEHLVNQDGIITDLILKTASPLIKPIMIFNDTGKMKAEIAFTYDSNNITQLEDVSSYANFCIATGVHTDAFIEGVTKYFRDYMNKIYLPANSKITVIGNDIRTGLRGVVSVSVLVATFSGQAKNVLTNTEVFPFVKNLVISSLEQWSKENPNDLQKLCKYFKEIAEIRSKSDDNKIKLSTKYQTSLLSGMPKKYIKPSGNKDLELFILEGDSALGSARGSRITATQGLFPIRGKIPNAFTTEKSKFLSNEEVASIITIIGGGYGKNFELDKVKWSKVIFLADADPDGAHINSLLLRFFLLYLPELIKAGKVYRAVPPLYGIKMGKKIRYFTDKIDFTRYNQANFSKNNVITTLTNSKLTSNECIDLFIKNMDYTYELEIISNTYAIDPYLLENILFRYRTEEQKKDFKNFKKSIEGIYRFLKVRQENDEVVIEGLVDSKYHTIFLNNQMLNSCQKIIDIMNNNELLFYKVNGEMVSIYMLMKIYESSLPKDITRYKGLGEQNPMQLAESTLYIENRTLVRYTIEDIVKEIDSIRYMESNRQELLKNVNVTRQDVE